MKHFARTEMLFKNKVTYHSYDFGVNSFRKNPPAGRYVVNDFIKSCPLDLFPLEICDWIHEIESHATLSELANEKFLLLGRRNV